MRKQTQEEQYSVEQDSASFLYADDMAVLGHSETWCRNSWRYDNCSSANWLDHKCVQNQIYMFNRKKRGTEPEETDINWWRYGNVEIFKYIATLVTELMLQQGYV